MLSAGQRSLKQRVLTAGAWRLSAHILSQLIRFGSNLLMTRLLVPEMFGIIAVAMMIIVGLTLFSDLGLKQNIVQSKRGNDPDFLNTAWTIQILRGVALWAMGLFSAILLLSANTISVFPTDSVYANPTLPYVIATLSFITVIAGFQSTKFFEASRNISLGQVTKIELVSQAAGLLAMFGWAFFDRSIWALVVGNFCALVVTSTLSHTWLPGVSNHWRWDRSAAQEIFHFGKWIMMSSILGFLVINGDRLLLGGFVSAGLLGVYVIASSIYGAVEQLVTKMISDIMFPALSEVARDRPSDLKSRYYRLFIATGSFVYFSAGFLIASGHILIYLLYDSRYHEAGWMLEILAAGLLVVPFHVSATCFLALGFSKLFSHLLLIRALALFILVPLGFHFFDLPGALIGIVLSSYASLPVIVYFLNRHQLFDLRKEWLLLLAGTAGLLAGAGFNYLAEAQQTVIVP